LAYIKPGARCSAAGLIKVDCGLVTVLDLNGLQRYGT
jgi:hypothetical protein